MTVFMSCLLLASVHLYHRLDMLLLRGVKALLLIQICWRFNILITLSMFSIPLKNNSTVIKQNSRLMTDCKEAVSKINRALNSISLPFPKLFCVYINTPHVPRSSPYFTHLNYSQLGISLLAFFFSFKKSIPRCFTIFTHCSVYKCPALPSLSWRFYVYSKLTQYTLWKLWWTAQPSAGLDAWPTGSNNRHKS